MSEESPPQDQSRPLLEENTEADNIILNKCSSDSAKTGAKSLMIQQGMSSGPVDKNTSKNNREKC